MKYGALKLTVTFLAAALLVTGCGTPEQFYRLSASGPAITRAAGMAVGLGQVTLPTYVDRAELVFQSGPNQFDIPAKVRWAGSLQDNFRQVLATDLGRHLGSGNVSANPLAGDTKLRYRVSVTVRQFHAISGQGVVLDASWRVDDAMTGQVLRSAGGTFGSPVNGDGYAPVVAAESDLIEQLATSISQSLKRR